MKYLLNIAVDFYGELKIFSQIDTADVEGLAKPHYEKFIDCVTADSATAMKSCQQLIQSYSYLAFYYELKKDNINTILYLKKEIALALS